MSVTLALQPPPAAPIPAIWEGLLDGGEKVFWQGRPDTRAVATARWIPEILFWMFGLAFSAVGLTILFKSNNVAAERRRCASHTLTNRRAIAATPYPRSLRMLKSCPIDPDSPLKFEDFGEVGTVLFSCNAIRNPKAGHSATDAKHVWSLMRQIQQEAK